MTPTGVTNLDILELSVPSIEAGEIHSSAATAGHVLTADGAGGASWQAPGSGLVSVPVTRNWTQPENCWLDIAAATGLQLPGASGVGLHIHLCYGSQYLTQEIDSTAGYRYTVWPLLFLSAIEPISWSPAPAIHTTAHLFGVIPGHEW